MKLLLPCFLRDIIEKIIITMESIIPAGKKRKRIRKFTNDNTNQTVACFSLDMLKSVISTLKSFIN